jgi:hypothetical protein
MLPLIGAGLGIASGILGAGAERRKEESQGKMKAAEMSAAPWTHMAPTTDIQFASPLAGKMLGGAGAGLALGQSLSNAGATSPWASMGKITPESTPSVADAAQKFGVSEDPRMLAEAPSEMQPPTFTRPGGGWGLGFAGK